MCALTQKKGSFIAEATEQAKSIVEKARSGKYDVRGLCHILDNLTCPDAWYSEESVGTTTVELESLIASGRTNHIILVRRWWPIWARDPANDMAGTFVINNIKAGQLTREETGIPEDKWDPNWRK